MKTLWLFLALLIPASAVASQPMTAPPKSHPRTHFALRSGQSQLILNVTHWTSFKIKSDYPVSIFEKGCSANVSGVTNTSFICDVDSDITITDDRDPLLVLSPANVIRIKWVTTGETPIPLFGIAPGSHR